LTAARALAVVCLAGLSACTVGPNYRQPDVPMPPAFSELSNPAGPPTSDADLARWWLQFRDPVLQSLIERALANNLGLEAAASRIRQSRFDEKVARAGQWPTVNAIGAPLTLNSDGSSGGGTSGAPAQGFEIPGHLNLYAAGFDATWEIDLFGGVRRQIEAAKANSDAAVWARRDSQVTLTAEVAADYLTLREVQTRIDIAEAELHRQKDIGALVASRREAGFVTNLDVNQQTGATAAAAAQLRQLEAEERTQIHAIAVLLGEPPETLEPTLARGAAQAPPPPELPAGLPSQLLQRRPDIREAERKLAAANAEIGVQTAGLYPKLDLIGLAAFASPTISNLFSSQAFSSAGVGMVTAPLFTAGKTLAQINEAKEQATQAEIAYRSAILGALRDAEDALARYRSEEARRVQLAQAVSAADNSLTIAKQQYSVGLVTFLNVYTAETTLLNARDQLAQSDAAAAQDLVSLYKALGGGWAA